MAAEPIQTPEEGTEHAEQPATPAAEPENPPTPPTEPQNPEPDYKEKFSESSRENQLLRERIAVLETERKELTKDPTDSDYRAAFPEWDALDEGQKADKRRLYNAERAALSADQRIKALEDERSRNNSIELVLSSNDALQGKESAFRQFASRPQYKNIPVDVLVKAFLGENPPEQPTPTPTEKKLGLLPGNGGPRTSEKPKTLSGAELKKLRETDSKAWAEYVRTHDIEIEE